MKRFKTKKHIKIKYKKILILLLTLIITIIILKILNTIKIIKLDPIQTLKYQNIYEKKHIKQELINITSQILRIDIKKPETILNHMIPYEKPNKKKYYTVKEEQPLIYIYNTHQTEEYIGNNITPTPTVKTAAYYLKEQLEKENIKTIVEEQNIQEILKNNNWNYTDSYKASRINLEKIKNEYPSIKIFIDLHRDALPKKLSTATINNKNYAKILFVIGKEHENYKKNLEFTTSINNIIEKNYPSLTKGILQKEGPGVNGIYNQDIKENIILMEVGAEENTIDEVTNTLDIITNVLKEKINEK